MIKFELFYGKINYLKIKFSAILYSFFKGYSHLSISVYIYLYLSYVICYVYMYKIYIYIYRTLLTYY